MKVTKKEDGIAMYCSFLLCLSELVYVMTLLA